MIEVAADAFTGGCLCGAVRYECGPPVIPACFCHCASCRRASGAHIVAWVTVRLSEFRVTSGHLRQFESSKQATRQFCETCGTPITYASRQSPGEIDLTLGSFDDPGAITPVDHLWMDDAPPWDRPRDGLSQFCTRRDAAKQFQD